ncbi:hypothetical protein DRN73_06680 [Candidatus Pacearchaeota archaeon]|nr:MAG: hypothetical protein DRN73_06680 [Candidatus Pacearchaeota archaeon]
MKKIITALLLLLLISPLIFAINLNIEEKSVKNTIIKELDNPANFVFSITNNGEDDNFSIYNLLGFNIEPKTISIKKGETKQLNLIVYQRKDLELTNFYTFSIYIRGKDSSEVSKKIMIKSVSLKDVFEIGSGEIDPDSNSIIIYIQNKEDFKFENLNVLFKSKFFELNKTFDLNSYEKKTFSIQLNKEDFNKLIAGFYTLDADLKIENKTAQIQGIIKFIEKNIIETKEKNYGFIIRTKIIQKTNNGNAIEKTKIITKKNIISRLFTSFNTEPDSIDRQGTQVIYSWERDINPGESLEIKITTNYLFPLLIALFVSIITALVIQFTKTDVVLKKKVSFVKAKGGEFALKISLFVYSKKYVERVNIIDRIPQLMKVYERFGGEKPHRINNNLIEWNFEKLEQGEIRTLSYVIYSKNLGVMGKFALPSASVIYQRDGKIKESQSNKAFFIAEPKKEEDYF